MGEHRVERAKPRTTPKSSQPHPTFTSPQLGQLLQKSTLTQLQRTHGNRRVLQMVRDKTVARLRPSAGLRGRRVVQLDRLIEMPNVGKDEKDFAGVREQVEKSLRLGSSGTWFKQSDFALGKGETLYIWGHMDENGIGSMSFKELAAHMVRGGFTGCAEIRLIGCNNPTMPQTAPRRLYEALAQYIATPGLAKADLKKGFLPTSETYADEKIPAEDSAARRHRRPLQPRLLRRSHRRQMSLRPAVHRVARRAVHPSRSPPYPPFSPPSAR